jgi:hypothetical protein
VITDEDGRILEVVPIATVLPASLNGKAVIVVGSAGPSAGGPVHWGRPFQPAGNGGLPTASASYRNSIDHFRTSVDYPVGGLFVVPIAPAHRNP